MTLNIHWGATVVFTVLMWVFFLSKPQNVTGYLIPVCLYTLIIILIKEYLNRQSKDLMNEIEKALADKDEKMKKLYESHARLEEKYAASYTLSLIQQYILHEFNEEKLLTKITDIVQGILGSSASAIFGLSDRYELELLSSSGLKDNSPFQQIAGERESILYRALKLQKAYELREASPEEKKYWQEQGIKSLLCIPLYTKDEQIGVMVVAHFQEEMFTMDQRALLQIIANQVSLAMENIKLHQETQKMAWHDQLTGLLNRGYLNNYFNLLESGYGSNLKLNCLLFDIDHFKQINDRHGHLTGDEVLKKVASILQKYSTEDCISVRFGGEEFLIFSTNNNLTCLIEMAEKIRAEIAAATFISKSGEEFSITISGGIASLPKHARNIEELLMKADEALYQAKKSGRNRILVYN